MFQDRVLFYIDILGFTEFILSKDTDYKEVIKESMDKILKVSQVFQEKKGSKINVNTSIMSDSVVCSFEVSDRNSNIINLAAIFIACTAFQSSLLRMGILSRGALIREGCNHMNNIVYGPALIHAYHMEREKAVFPRVIFHDSAKKFVDELKSEKINKFLNIDNDKLIYIDYLSRLEEYSCDRKKIKALIDQKINEQSEKVKVKYRWIKEKI